MNLNGQIKTENGKILPFDYYTYHKDDEVLSLLKVDNKLIGKLESNCIENEMFMDHMFNGATLESLKQISISSFEIMNFDDCYWSMYEKEPDYYEGGYYYCLSRCFEYGADFKTTLKNVYELTVGYKNSQENEFLITALDKFDEYEESYLNNSCPRTDLNRKLELPMEYQYSTVDNYQFIDDYFNDIHGDDINYDYIYGDTLLDIALTSVDNPEDLERDLFYFMDEYYCDRLTKDELDTLLEQYHFSKLIKEINENMTIYDKEEFFYNLFLNKEYPYCKLDLCEFYKRYNGWDYNEILADYYDGNYWAIVSEMEIVLF